MPILLKKILATYAWSKSGYFKDPDPPEKIILAVGYFLIKLIDSGQPLDEIAQVVLYRGYTQGMYSPDLMLMLIEPTLYLLIAIADYADIEDYVLYEGEDTDPDAEIHGDDEEPINMDEKEEFVKERIEPKKESLRESLLEKLEKELPTKVRDVKERE